MELAEALQNALYILEEERVRPTLSYRYVGKEWPPEMKWEESNMRQQGYTPSMAAVIGLTRMRQKRPREVAENPKLFVFESVNFNLLLSILNQLAPENRPKFVEELLKRMLAVAPTNASGVFPSWSQKTSPLALVAQFCIRNGYAQSLLNATLQLKVPSAGLAIMLIEIEEILSLNFNLFSPAQINSLRNSLAPLREMAELQTYSAKGSAGKMVGNPAYRPGREKEGQEIVDAIDAIVQQCNQARYFYLKNVLQQNTNLEVESDKTKVVGFLDSLGFDPLLTASLAKAEELYLSSSNVFDLKSCLGHIRSFYEHLNIDAGQAFARHLGATVVDKWDPTLTFLKNKSFLSEQQDKFARGIYALLSDEGVHPDLPPIFSPGIMRLSPVLGSPTLHLQPHSHHRKRRLRPAEPCERSRT
ncbi:MAG: hypothetical protein LAO09_22475, partial [Acidobacteriia bacterium]|nr:hypothetical protein [Terriglobia bacterium]